MCIKDKLFKHQCMSPFEMYWKSRVVENDKRRRLRCVIKILRKYLTQKTRGDAIQW